MCDVMQEENLIRSQALPAKGGGEPGTFYDVCDVKGRQKLCGGTKLGPQAHSHTSISRLLQLFFRVNMASVC